MRFFSRLWAKRSSWQRHLELTGSLCDIAKRLEALESDHAALGRRLTANIKSMEVALQKHEDQRPWQEVNFEKRQELRDAIEVALATKGPARLGRGAHVNVEIVYDVPDAGGEAKEAGDLARSGALEDDSGDTFQEMFGGVDIERMCRFLRKNGNISAAELLDRAKNSMATPGDGK